MLDAHATRDVRSSYAAPPARPRDVAFAPSAPARHPDEPGEPVSPALGLHLTGVLARAEPDDEMARVDSAHEDDARRRLDAAMRHADAPWPIDLACELVLCLARLVDAAAAAGSVAAPLTPRCVSLVGARLVLGAAESPASADPAYVAPEQREPGAAVDARAAQFGLATLAARLLDAPTGRTRWRAGTAALGTRAGETAARVLAVAHDPDPCRRFSTACDFALALEAACGPAPRPLWSPPPAVGLADRAWARPLTSGTTSVVLGVVALATWLGLTRGPSDGDGSPDATAVTRSAHAAALAGTAGGDSGLLRGSAAGVLDEPETSERPADDAAGRAARGAAGRGGGGERRPPARPSPTGAGPIVPPLPRLPRVAIGTLGGAFALPSDPADRRLRALLDSGLAPPPAPVGSVGAPLGVRAGAAAPATGADVGTPMPLPESVGPAYPPGLLARRRAGEVVARFDVDERGHVVEGSFAVLRATDPEFVDAVRAALGGMRYRPAERGGRAVRQAVEQRFQFVPRR